MSNSIPSRAGCAVIADGYTRPAFLAGIPFTTPDVRFSYRPILAATLAVIRREMAKASGTQLPQIQAKTMEKYITDWDVKDADGEPVPLKAESLLNVSHEIFDGVSGIILGVKYTDIDPEWPNATEEPDGTTTLDELFAKEKAAVKN